MINEWYFDMTEFLQPNKIGDFSLENFEIKDNDIYAMLHGIKNGKYVRLMQNGNILMSNTEMEERTNEEFVLNAHGDVLIGGLGIGMVLLAIQDISSVNKITVVEKHQEVIDLVASQLPLKDKVEIVCADVFEYVPEKKYNTIYMDIWEYINEDIYYNQMCPLLEKYEMYLDMTDKDRYLDCWCSYEAKNRIRI